MSVFKRIKGWFGGAPAEKPEQPAQEQVQLSLLDGWPDAVENGPEAGPTASQPTPSTRFRERRGQPRLEPPEGTRIMIVDDSQTLVTLLRKMLDQNNYETIVAHDAETAIAMACEDPPDLIFLDIVLPGMNGFEALRRMRREPRTKNVPVIMISGNEQAVEQFYAQRIGADDFMKKPFSRSEVFARIEALRDENGAIRHRQHPRAAQQHSED